MNLQENIQRIKEVMGLSELYDPSGKSYEPSKFVYHKSNPVWRKNILKTGLLVSVGDCYKTYSENFSKEECIPAIFATDSENKDEWFESTWDDDVWRINTKIADVTWFKDKHFENMRHPEFKYNHIVTFEDIKPEALKLIYKGTGKSN
jgi:hypothetical protein